MLWSCNDFRGSDVMVKTAHMLKDFTSLLIVIFLAMPGCTKNTISGGEDLYGVWVKGSNAGDTLRFFEKNGKNVLSYSLSFNPQLPMPTEREFKLNNDQLSLQLLGGSRDFQPITSFKWISRRETFEIEGIEFFPFMASMRTYFTYRKIR